MSKEKKILFDDSENEDDSELHINKVYANKYQEWRLSEELQKYKDRFGEEDLTSESSSDEEYAEADNPEFDREFLRTLGALHKKDLNLESTFFTGDYSRKTEKKQEEKVMTVKDYERLLITSRAEELDEEEAGLKSAKNIRKRSKDKEISEFEDGLKSDENDSEDDLLASGLFKVKKSDTPTEEQSQPKNYDNPLAFIRGESTSLKNEEDRGLLEGLKRAWNDPKKSEDEKWLIDFFVNERFNEEDDDSKMRPYNGVVIDEETISEDEKTLETMETFETKYRFRFEEPDEEFIKKYPRIIPDSMRAKDDRRKQKRIALKERKQKEKEIKRQEIERLKALKYKEIEAKIEKIKEASGNQDIDLGEKLLDDDFDESHHEKMMSRMFGEDYYAEDEGTDEKPVFEDDEDIDVIKDYDHWLEKQGGNASNNEEIGEWEEEEDGHYSMDDGYDERVEAKKTLQQEMIEASTKKKGRRKSKFANAIKKKKPVFDPNEKTFESYFDEYYQLDFEDIISGMPCRFKYRKVEPNSFGLSTEEILTAQDRELNRWASLKKMLRYERDQNQELRDTKMYQHRASLTHVKQKILPSLFVEDPVQHHISEEEKKRLKNQKKKLRREQKRLDKMKEDNQQSTSNAIPHDGELMKKGTKRKDIEFSVKDHKDETHAVTNETIQQSKKKKRKKKLTENNFRQENQDVEIGSSKNVINTIVETQQSKNTTTESEENNGTQTNTSLNNSSDTITNSNKKRKKKKRNKETASDTIQRTKVKKKPRTQENSFFHGISDTRLAAYGENPKKIRNKVKYGKKEF